jgi:hypothetical protein
MGRGTITRAVETLTQNPTVKFDEALLAYRSGWSQFGVSSLDLLRNYSVP